MRPSRVVPVVILSVAAVGLLAGCVPEPTPSASPSPTRTVSASPTSTPEPSATGTPLPVLVPVTESCEQLVTAQQLYDYNPNFAALGPFTPDAGTPAATAVADKGVACRFQNTTSAENVDVSVADYGDATAETRAEEAIAAGASPVTLSVGDSASFGVSGGVGTLTLVDGSHWISVSSTTFRAAEDAAPFAEAAADALG